MLAFRGKLGSADISSVFGLADILRVREPTTGLIVDAGKDQHVTSDRSVEFSCGS